MIKVFLILAILILPVGAQEVDTSSSTPISEPAILSEETGLSFASEVIESVKLKLSIKKLVNATSSNVQLVRILSNHAKKMEDSIERDQVFSEINILTISLFRDINSLTRIIEEVKDESIVHNSEFYSMKSIEIKGIRFSVSQQRKKIVEILKLIQANG